MRILGTDIVDMPVSFITDTGIEMLSREKLLREADFVSINCDLNPTSHHIMDEAMFGLMKTTAALINTARGPIVKERALVNALETGAIAGAALDVFEDEPLPAASALTGMDNVMLAPHNANSSPEAWEKVHINTINNLLTVLNA
jgi:phosphoglycerate dehydrogenase-like enzyme